MQPTSLAIQTDLIFSTYDGEITDRGNYLVIRTPTNPTFYWGNTLLFAQPPQPGDFDRWRALFATEIGVPPQTEHETYGWDTFDGSTGAVEPFLAAGFRLDRGVALACAATVLPPRLATHVTMRALTSDADWQQAIANQVLCREPEFDEAGFWPFRTKQMARYRRMVADGLGDWYGAFHGDRLVADCGLFHNSAVADGTLGRYQSVQTHPDFRSQGIATTMIAAVGRLGQAKHGLTTLVIVTDPDSQAERVYTSVGFRPVERTVGLERWAGMEVD